MRRTCLLFLAAVLTLPVHAQVDPRSIDHAIEQMLAAWHVPGAAVAIVQDDRVVYLGAAGVKELGKSDRVTPDTLFGIASTSKAFTTTAMAMLVDEKKLDWDDPVRKYLPWFQPSDPCTAALVTLRDIVSHRSGLATHNELWDNTTLTREQVIRGAISATPWKPIRTAYQYNNVMFITAGEALASAAGMSWDSFVQQRIFTPLGMNHTLTAIQPFLVADHATGHRYRRATDSISIQPLEDDFNLGSAGSIKSSARDMAQWLRFQLAGGVIDGKRLVSAEALEETKKPNTVEQVDREASPETHVESYAMGWNVQDFGGELLISHAGALNGYRTQVALFPDRHLGIVVLINAGRGYAGIGLRNWIADAFLGHPARDWNSYYLALDAKGDEKAAEKQRERESKRNPAARPTHDLLAYAGTYTNPYWGPATVAFENGALVLRWQRLVLPLVSYAYDTFSAASEADDIDEDVTFQLAPEGDIASLQIFGQTFTRERAAKK